ncbi:protein FAM163A-like [Tenrec ecaudatus]|uniref:protein FAM163A-like n=1 Tax=Tenrec ecaudatus TaxID=94439 RepID=UPI003F5A4F40
MTAGTVVITGGILATVILLCIIAVLCYCRLQYYCCKKSGAEDADDEEEEHDRPPRPRGPSCNACSSQGVDSCGNLAPLANSEPCGAPGNHCTTCSPYSSPFYIRTVDMVPNGGGGERLAFAPTYYKEGGPLPLKMAAPQSYPVTWPGSGHEAFTNPRAISTDV